MTLFAKGANYALELLAAQAGYDVLGIDWCIDPVKARQLVGDKVALQGNMDPNMLFHVLKTTRPSSLLLEGFSATDLCRGSLAKVLCGPYGVQLSEVQYHIMVLRTDTKVPEMLVCAPQLMNVKPHMNGIAGCFN